MLHTERLLLRELAADDAPFIVALLNDPAFLEFIGDRGVRDEGSARGYIERARAGYLRNGFGLYAVTLRADGVAIGLCGLVRRDTLPHVDVGFALLPLWRRMGFTHEATTAVLAQADTLGVAVLLAICTPSNVGSRALLEALGFAFEKHVTLEGDAQELCLYRRQ